MSPNVHEWLVSLVAGERAGSAWLYDTFAAKLFRRLRQRYAYPGGIEAEDLLHDAFVFYFQHDYRVLRSFLDRVPRPQQTLARLERHLWDLACGIAANRRRSSKSSPLLDIEPRDQPSPAPGAERSLVNRDRLVRLDTCLEGKGERLYLYYKLRFRDGLAPEEIAHATGWSRKSTYKLKQTLNRAVEECAEQLQLTEA